MPGAVKTCRDTSVLTFQKIHLQNAAVDIGAVAGIVIAPYDRTAVTRHYGRNTHGHLLTGDGAALQLIALAGGQQQQCGCCYG